MTGHAENTTSALRLWPRAPEIGELSTFSPADPGLPPEVFLRQSAVPVPIVQYRAPKLRGGRVACMG